jgi:hypothetical protein
MLQSTEYHSKQRTKCRSSLRHPSDRRLNCAFSTKTLPSVKRTSELVNVAPRFANVEIISMPPTTFVTTILFGPFSFTCTATNGCPSSSPTVLVVTNWPARFTLNVLCLLAGSQSGEPQSPRKPAPANVRRAAGAFFMLCRFCACVELQQRRQTTANIALINNAIAFPKEEIWHRREGCSKVFLKLKDCAELNGDCPSQVTRPMILPFCATPGN